MNIDARNASNHVAAPAQLTIFYGGMVNVYEGISPEKVNTIVFFFFVNIFHEALFHIMVQTAIVWLVLVMHTSTDSRNCGLSCRWGIT